MVHIKFIIAILVPNLNGLLGSSGLHRQEPMERHKVLLKLAFSGDLTQKWWNNGYNWGYNML